MAAKHEILEAFEQIKSELRDAKVELGAAKTLWAKIQTIHALVPHAVDLVEAVSIKLDIRGADKKQLAMDAIFAIVKLPWWLPEKPMRVLVGMAIDAVVDGLNRHLKNG